MMASICINDIQELIRLARSDDVVRMSDRVDRMSDLLDSVLVGHDSPTGAAG